MINREAWLKAIEERDPIPNDDAVTTIELAQMLGVGRRSAQNRINDLIIRGKAEPAGTRMVIASNGRRVPVPVYRLIEEPKDV